MYGGAISADEALKPMELAQMSAVEMPSHSMMPSLLMRAIMASAAVLSRKFRLYNRPINSPPPVVRRRCAVGTSVKEPVCNEEQGAGVIRGGQH